MALERLSAQMGDTVTLQVLSPSKRLATALLCANKAPIIVMFPFVSEQFGHARERPATAFRVTDKRPFTSVAPQVDFEAAGLVVCLLTAREVAGKVACFSEVSAIVGEQGTKGQESLFTTWKFTFVGPLRFKVNPLVIGQSGCTAKPLTADITDKGIVLLVDFNVSFKVIDSGKAPAAAFHLAHMWPLFAMGLDMSLEFIRGGKRPATALHGALEWPGILSMVQEVNFEFLS